MSEQTFDEWWADYCYGATDKVERYEESSARAAWHASRQSQNRGLVVALEAFMAATPSHLEAFPARKMAAPLIAEARPS